VILRALGVLEDPENEWTKAALEAFGAPGIVNHAALYVGDATFPQAIYKSFRGGNAKQLGSLITKATTVIRRQTCIDRKTGAAEEHSLRATRLLRRNEELQAPLRYHGSSLEHASPQLKALVATAARLSRRGGLHRTRGWGHLDCRVLHHGNDPQWETRLTTVLEGRAS